MICPALVLEEERSGMNSQRVSAMKLPNRWVEARSASTWIERFALPIAISSMEAQPIGLVVALILFVFTRTFSPSALSPSGTAMLLLGLLWWAMGVEALFLSGRIQQRKLRPCLHWLSWLGALAIIVGPG